MPTGTYTDEVSGAVWTVTASKITGHVGSAGIAVFYDVEKIGQTALLIGDVDLDSEVTIVDATCIQRNLASLCPLSAEAAKAADCDRDNEVAIIDATLIQRFLVGLKDENSHVAEAITS